MADAIIDFRNRIALYADIIEAWVGDKKDISILEVGVFRGHLSEGIGGRLGSRIKRYVGVDPYLASEDDPYLIGYWKGDISVADRTYKEAQDRLGAFGGELHRKTSSEWFEHDRDMYDIIIIDGDHREEPCYNDLTGATPRLLPGGLLLCDDYANPDHPGVTKAAVRFDRDRQDTYKKVGFQFCTFNNASRRIPYPLGVAYWEKAT